MFRIDFDVVIDVIMVGGFVCYINYLCMVSFFCCKFVIFVLLVVDLDLYFNSDDWFYFVCVVGELLDVFFLCRL